MYCYKISKCFLSAMILLIPIVSVNADSPGLYQQNKQNVIRSNQGSSNFNRPNSYLQTDQNYYYNNRNQNRNQNYRQQQNNSDDNYNYKSVRNIYEPN